MTKAISTAERQVSGRSIKWILQAFLIGLILLAAASGIFFTSHKYIRPAKPVSSLNAALQKELTVDACILADKDLCHFLANWQNQPYYIAISSEVSDDYSLQSRFEAR